MRRVYALIDRVKGTDIPVLITSPRDSLEEQRAVLLNGSATPAPLESATSAASRWTLPMGDMARRTGGGGRGFP